MIRKSKLLQEYQDLKQDIKSLQSQNFALAWALTHDRAEITCNCALDHPLSNSYLNMPQAVSHFFYTVKISYFDAKTISVKTRNICKTHIGSELKLISKEYDVTSNIVTVVVEKIDKSPFIMKKESTLYKIETDLDQKQQRLWINSPVGNISPIWTNIPYYNNEEDWILL